jgi:hypothetical protein
MNEKDVILKEMIDKESKIIFFTYDTLNEYLFPELNIDQVKYLVETIQKEQFELLNKPKKWSLFGQNLLVSEWVIEGVNNRMIILTALTYLKTFVFINTSLWDG